MYGKFMMVVTFREEEYGRGLGREIEAIFIFFEVSVIKRLYLFFWVGGYRVFVIFFVVFEFINISFKME